MKLSEIDPKDIKVVEDKENPLEQFKSHIKKIESRGSGGYQALGQPIEYGVSAGKRAIGAYQFTPETIDTIAGSSIDKDVQALKTLNDVEKQELLFSNPTLQDKLADAYAEKLFKLAGNDPLKAAWAWNQGPGRIPKFDPSHEYVQKYKEVAKIKDEPRTPSSKETLKLSNINPNDIKVVESEPNKSDYSELESAGLGALQGATLGYADELEAALRSMFPGEKYTDLRDTIRARYTQAEKENPKSYLAGNIGGGIATTAIPGMGIAKGASLGKAALQAGALGAVTGLGVSEADLTKGDIAGAAIDTTVGGVLGATTGALGQKLSKALTPTNTEARAVARATKALGAKPLPENISAGKAVLDEDLLNIFGGSPKLAKNIQGKISQLEGDIVQPVLQGVSSNVGKPQAIQQVLQKGTAKSPMDMITSSINKVMTDQDPNLPANILQKTKRTISKELFAWNKKIEQTGGDPKQLNELRKTLDGYIKSLNKNAFKIEDSKPKIDALLNLREELNSTLRNISSEISTGAGEDLTRAMGRQSNLYAPLEMAEKLVEKDIAHPPGSIMDIIRNPLTNPRALGAGASTLLHSPLPAIGAAATIATEKATKQPIGRLGNVISAKTQRALAGTGVGRGVLKVGEKATEAVASSVRNAGVQSNLQGLYSAPKEQILDVANKLKNSPNSKNIGTALENAENSNDMDARNRVLFAAWQNPTHRAILQENVQAEEENVDDLMMGGGENGI